MGKGCRTPVSLRPGEKADPFLGPEALSAPRQPGLGVSSPAEPSYAQRPHHMGGVKAERSPCLTSSFRGGLQLEVRDGVSNVSLSSVQLSFRKAGFSGAIKPRAIADFTPFKAAIASLRPLPRGAGRKKQGRSPAGLGEGNSCRESGPQGTGSRSFRVVALSWHWAGVTWGGWKMMLLRERAREVLQCHGGSPTSAHRRGLGANVIHSLRSAFPRRSTSTEPRACKFLSPLPMNLHVLTA
ncbi:unnamed protein product [Coccothraustes coccothraustes]